MTLERPTMTGRRRAFDGSGDRIQRAANPLAQFDLQLRQILMHPLFLPRAA
jgi:hypothetical protein